MKKGFTLVEVLVVMAIIAFLAAILLPALSSARERAARTNCMNNLKQFSIAYEMYAEDYFERFPDSPDALYATPSDCIYHKYIKDAKIFWCPSNSHNLPPDGDICKENNPPTRNDWNNSYAFVFGLTTSNNCPKPVPVVSDKGVFPSGNHKGGMNVLYLEGNVIWVKAEDIVYYNDSRYTPPPKSPEDTPHGVNVACDVNGASISLMAEAITKIGIIVNASDYKEEWGQP